MALLVLTSAAGSPGVTTLALGLTLAWPRSVILVDADPGAYQAILAGFLGGQVRTAKGLQRVAEAHRDRRPLREVVSDQTIPLVAETTPVPAPASSGPTPPGRTPPGRTPIEAAGHSRRLLPGFLRPANAALFGPVWPDLADTFATLGDTGIDVIVDAGRLGPQGLVQPLIERADACLLLTRSSLRAVAASRGAATVLAEQSRLTGGADNLGLIVVDDGRPYRGPEIGRLLGLPVVSTVPDDPASARCLVEGAPRGRRFDSAPLPKALPHLVSDLQARVQRRSEQLGGGARPSGATVPSSGATTPAGAPTGGGR